jgi:hypothetical protein
MFNSDLLGIPHRGQGAVTEAFSGMPVHGDEHPGDHSEKEWWIAISSRGGVQ